MRVFKLFCCLLHIIITFLANSAMPRAFIVKIVRLFKFFIVDVMLHDLKIDILDALNQPNPRFKIEQSFQECERIFDHVKTEKKIFKQLRQRGLIDYKLEKVCSCLVEKIVNNDIKLFMTEIYEVYIPLVESLQQFLEIPNMFQNIMDYMNKVRQDTSGIISNIIQTQNWKKNFDDSGKIILPLFVHFNEFETGIALGSHAGVHKFGAIYTYIACLPPSIASKLSSIIFTGLICAKDKKLCTNEQVFKYLIDELNYLSTKGIALNINNAKKIVYFQLTLIIGDNLGLNEIFDMIESFKDTPFCRVCRAKAHQWKYMVKEEKTLLRNTKNYEADCLANDPQKTGIKQKSTFNSVHNFNILTNTSFDIMHDILHGVATYVLRAIVYDFVFDKKYFTLQELNTRIQNFDFGHNEGFNKPPEFKPHAVKKKVILKCSAAEMLVLLRYFGLIIGKVIDDYEDPHWQLYLYLRQILDIVMSPRVIPAYVIELDDLVEKLNSTYIKLYGKLKPKFHLMIHYGQFLLVNGPLVFYWSMRFESRHRQLKSVATAISCKVNSLVSIAVRETIKMCSMINSFWCEDNYDEVDEEHQVQNRVFYKRLDINGFTYTLGTIVVIDNSSLLKEFGEIKSMYKENDVVYFNVKKYVEFAFDKNAYAYILGPKQLIKETTITYEDIPKLAPCLTVRSETYFYVIPCYKL